MGAAHLRDPGLCPTPALTRKGACRAQNWVDTKARKTVAGGPASTCRTVGRTEGNLDTERPGLTTEVPPQATLQAWALGREMENKRGKWLPGLPSCACYWGRDPLSLHLHLDFRRRGSLEGRERNGKEAGENFRALKKRDSTVCSGPLGSSQEDPLGPWEPRSRVLSPRSPFCCWSCVRSPVQPRSRSSRRDHEPEREPCLLEKRRKVSRNPMM